MENQDEYIGVGTKVAWMVATKVSKNRYALSTRYGEVADFKGDYVVVKMRNNHRVLKKEYELRLPKEGENLLLAGVRT